MSTSKSQQNLSSRYSASQTGKSGFAGKGWVSKKSMWGLLVAAVAIVTVIAVIIIATGGKEVDGGYNHVVTPDNIEELKANNAAGTVAAGTYEVRMNSTWKFANARTASSNAYVENALSNTNTVFFTIISDETGEQLYRSPYIPVGSSLRNIKLEKEDIGKGTHSATVVYHLVDDSNNELSTVNIRVTLEIEND